MPAMPGEPQENKAPPLKERELTYADTKVIELALRMKRPVGWVHAMAMVRRIQELEAEIVKLRAQIEDRGQAGGPSR